MIKIYKTQSEIKKIIPQLLKNHLHIARTRDKFSVARVIFRDSLNLTLKRPIEFKNYSYNIKKLAVFYLNKKPVSWALLVNENVKDTDFGINLHRYTKPKYRNRGFNKKVSAAISKKWREFL